MVVRICSCPCLIPRGLLSSALRDFERALSAEAKVHRRAGARSSVAPCPAPGSGGVDGPRRCGRLGTRLDRR